jgi:hypothetical protein
MGTAELRCDVGENIGCVEMNEFRPGLFFGMDADEYHAIPALSASGIKNLRASTLDFWTRSWMNTDQEEVSDAEDSFAKVLGTAYHKRIVEGDAAFRRCYAPSFTEDDCPKGTLKGNDALKKRLAELGLKTSGNKSDLTARLLEAEPTAKIYEVYFDSYAEQHEGKIFLPTRSINRIEVSAAMIEKHPQLSKAFVGGQPEVTIMWEAPVTHEDQSVSVVPMKARLDYLKPKAIVDLKSFGNPHGRPVERAVNQAFANYRYQIPAAVYQEAAAQIPGHIKAERVSGECNPALLEALLQGHEKTFLYVFQCSGPAPIAVGKTLPAHCGLFQIGQLEVTHAKEIFARCMKTYGSDPWVDLSEITAFEDSDVPSYATE